MKLGVSLLNLRVGKVGGIETYMRKLVEYAEDFYDDAEIVFFVNQTNSSFVSNEKMKIEVPLSERQISIRRIAEGFTPWRDKKMEKIIRETGVQAMLYPQQTMYPFSGAVPSLLTVADVQYLFSPQYYSKIDLAYRKRAYIGAMKICNRITPISNFTADHLKEKCGILSDKITVIPHGYDSNVIYSGGDYDDRRLIEEPYFYYPAATYKHKGHAQLFKTFAALKKSGKIKQKLILTGERTEYWKSLQKLIFKEGLESEVIHLGYVSCFDVQNLYQNADAILFPTEFEGFGLPLLEAIQFDKLVICSRLSVFSELGLPDEYQINFDNSEELLMALKLPETKLNIESLTWSEAVWQTFSLLKDVAEEGLV